MKCLVINLDRSPDRLAHITAEFARIGIAFERIVATDARDHPELALQPQFAIYAVRHLSSSEVACMHSHRACWSIIAQDDAPYGAVFEDDVVFSAKAGAILADSGWIPADADAVKLETFFSKTMIQRKRIAVGNGFSLFRLRRSHMGTGGYIVSRQMARDLLEATAQASAAADDLLFNPAFPTSASKTIYQLVPALCAQDQFVGDRLPSLLYEEREAEWVASGLTIKRRKPVAEKVRVEIRRVVEWVVDHCKLRHYTVVALDPPAEEPMSCQAAGGNENAL
ncbi:glycosyltransferase family 25 protein [Mesorhizobium sp. B263B2A]|uniref:glycosyltransferase family 25 protein n=1 Tax=Mesorhizobium sp. B263B2A TaxID=2876669 RepID=UPI001CD0A499|nr:glycosyltransferase family 25 protein [Mesorhizobium sp. B263B2A]MCA0034259.1 glycosyltransferase family 25 protein [Mesorhizobium sp. B263B2A]